MASIWQEIRQTFQRSDRIVTQLIMVNVVVFVVIILLRLGINFSSDVMRSYFFTEYLGVPSNLHQLLYQPWTLITSLFTHGDPFHILFNMLNLYWFGKILAEYLGNRKILPLYLLGGVSGALLYIISYNVFPVFDSAQAEARLWGASGSVVAILVAAATLLPDYTVFIILIGPVRLKWVALIAIILFVAFASSLSNPGGNLAHLGGALFGFIYIKQMQRGRDLGSGISWLIDWSVNLFRKPSHLKVSFKKKPANKTSTQNSGTSKQQRINSILDKISKSGYDALSKEEKDFLFSYSKENQ